MSLFDAIFDRIAFPSLFSVVGTPTAVSILPSHDAEVLLSDVAAVLGQRSKTEDLDASGTIRLLETLDVDLYVESLRAQWERQVPEEDPSADPAYIAPAYTQLTSWRGLLEPRLRAVLLLNNDRFDAWAVNQILSESQTIIRLRLHRTTLSEHARPGFRASP